MRANLIALTVGSPMHARAGRPPVAWWNPKLVAVLGHRPSGDREAARPQSRCQRHVGKRVSRVLCANDGAKSVLYRDRGDRATLSGENAWLKEVLEWKDAMRRIEILPTRGPTHRRVAYRNLLGDLAQDERPNASRTVVEETPLESHDCF